MTLQFNAFASASPQLFHTVSSSLLFLVLCSLQVNQKPKILDLESMDFAALFRNLQSHPDCSSVRTQPVSCKELCQQRMKIYSRQSTVFSCYIVIVLGDIGRIQATLYRLLSLSVQKLV
jgi:hypothetical protein